MKLFLLVLAGAAILPAQKLPVQLSAGVGYGTFLDESDQSHFTVSGAARFYFTRRNAIEPEVLYLYRDAGDKDLVVQANYVRDLGQARGRAVPYVIGGVGLLREIRPRFSTSSATVSGGIGVRIFMGDRFFLSPEVRIGTEPILRAQVSFGWASGR